MDENEVIELRIEQLLLTRLLKTIGDSMSEDALLMVSEEVAAWEFGEAITEVLDDALRSGIFIEESLISDILSYYGKEYFGASTKEYRDAWLSKPLISA